MDILMDESGAMYGKKCHGQESSDTVTERGRSADRALCCRDVTCSSCPTHPPGVVHVAALESVRCDSPCLA